MGTGLKDAGWLPSLKETSIDELVCLHELLKGKLLLSGILGVCSCSFFRSFFLWGEGQAGEEF